MGPAPVGLVSETEERPEDVLVSALRGHDETMAVGERDPLLDHLDAAGVAGVPSCGADRDQRVDLRLAFAGFAGERKRAVAEGDRVIALATEHREARDRAIGAGEITSFA